MSDIDNCTGLTFSVCFPTAPKAWIPLSKLLRGSTIRLLFVYLFSSIALQNFFSLSFWVFTLCIWKISNCFNPSLPFPIGDVHTDYLLNHVLLFKRLVFPLVLSVVHRDTRSHDTIQGHLSISCFAFLPKHLVSQVKCFNQLWYKL